MRSLILKPEFSLFTMRPQAGDRSDDSSILNKALLLLSRSAATLLAGIGVAVLLGNVLLGCGLLLQGPESIIEFLAQA